MFCASIPCQENLPMLRSNVVLFVICTLQLIGARSECCQPVAVATWHFGKIAVSAAAEVLTAGSAVDAVEAGVNAVEIDTKDQYFVGYGGLPNADGIMELDAAIMDGIVLTRTQMACPRI